MAVEFLQDVNLFRRLDVSSDIRIRGNSATTNVGVTRMYVDSSNNFFIDPGNGGTALTKFEASGRLTLTNYTTTGGFTGTATKILGTTATGIVVQESLPVEPVDNYRRSYYIVLNTGTTGISSSSSSGYTTFTITPSVWFGSNYNNPRAFMLQVVEAATGEIVGAEFDLNTGTADRIDIKFKGSVGNSDYDLNIHYTGGFGIQ